jgi:hypothetical protein
MHRRTFGLIALIWLSLSSRLEAACIDPAQLSHAAVSITRYFDDAERAAKPDVIGTRGTAWFLSPTTIVTAEHVSAGMTGSRSRSGMATTPGRSRRGSSA